MNLPGTRTPPAAPRVAESWRHDLLASVVVFLVALPLCMGSAGGGVRPARSVSDGFVGRR